MDMNWILLYGAGSAITMLFLCISYIVYYYKGTVEFSIKDMIGVLAGITLWPLFWLVWLVRQVWH